MGSRADLIEVSAPSKVILFGEHAVLSGYPALAIALDLGTSCRAFPSEDGEWRINRHALHDYRDKYVAKAVEILDGEPLHLSTCSQIPSASGMGSSASITASSVGAILAARNQFSEKECFRISHEVECQAEQRTASPLDSACICLGGGIVVNPGKQSTGEPGDTMDWKREDSSWTLKRVDLPEFNIVIGFSGIKGRTREVMESVSAFTSNQSTFYKEIITDIGKVSEEGILALQEGDMVKTGELMQKNHRLLATLGINRPEVQRLVDAANRHSLGAKMTGSGGGGCIIALTEDVEETAEAITRAGGVPILAEIDNIGVKVKTINT